MFGSFIQIWANSMWFVRLSIWRKKNCGKWITKKKKTVFEDWIRLSLNALTNSDSWWIDMEQWAIHSINFVFSKVK